MARTKDGGNAFPMFLQGNAEYKDQWAPGMSLRDWFAGQALTGIVQGTQSETMKPSSADEAAYWSYLIADAMIAAREAKS